MIDQVLGDQHVHHPERERGVGTRHQRQVLMAFFGGGASVRIDRDQFRAPPLRLLRPRPEVQVRHDRVAAPDQDQATVLELLDVGADRRADGGGPARLAGRRADRPVEQRRAEAVEEAAVHRAVLQESHRAGVRIGDDCLRSVARGRDGRKFRGDRVERLVPADPLEAAFALAADTLHRMQHALVGIRALEVMGDLGAQHAGGGGMVGGAANLDRAAVLDRHLQRARVGAVVRARAADDGAGQGPRGGGVRGHGLNAEKDPL